MPTSQLLIPVRNCVSKKGRFTLPARPVLAGPRRADALPLGQLAGDLGRLGLSPRVVLDAGTAAHVRIRRAPGLGREAYRLDVSGEEIEISASDDAGAYYAVQTLRGLLRRHGRRLAACRIDDAPDLARRGVYLDCSRGKVPTLETLKQLVERLAAWKINEFQLYVENVFTFRRHPAIGRGYSPFTPEEFLDLQAHCKSHHVRFVGSLSSFGHMEKILRLPPYRHLAELPGHMGYPGGTTLCPGNPGSIRLVADLYDEFLPLLEAEDFNVCCDETWELGRGRSAARAAKVGTGRVYLEFLLKIHALCQKHGKRMNAWADIVLAHPELLDGLPRDVVMLNWDYDAPGNLIRRSHEILDAGLPMMACPGTSSWQSHGTRLPNAMQNVANFAREAHRRGAEGLLNTDWGDYGHRNLLGASLHGMAHGGAHSWCGRKVDDPSFTDRFCRDVLGDARLAPWVRALGDSRISRRLYFILGERLVPSRGRWGWQDPGERIPLSKSWIDPAPPEDLRRTLQIVPEESRWPAPAKRLARFEALAVRELALAATMDRLSARRATLAKSLRAGEPVTARQLRELSADTERMAREFERFWLARNKPSRLRYNLAMFRQGAREAVEIARR